MKLLFVLNIGFDKSGPSVHLLKDVIEATLRKGHACHVVLKKTSDRAKSGMEELLEQYPALTTSFIQDNVSGKRSFIKRYLNDCRYALKCRKEYHGKKYDAVFLQSCNVGWVFMRGFRSLNCPVIFNIQDIFPQNLMFSGQLPASKISYPWLSYLQKVTYKRATRLITISHDMRETLARQGVNREKIDVVFNWSYADDAIRLSNIPAEHIYALNTDSRKTNVVYAGNIGKMQNVELIAKTAQLFEEDSSIHYYIIGDGANKTQIESMTEKLSNVTMLPMQPAIYAESIYAQADINVIPLVKGGIRTALPSKTATVLRTGKGVVFCIDTESEFEKMIGVASRIRVADNVDPSSLYRAICQLRSDADDVAEEDETVLSRLFSTRNAERYVEIIENAVLTQRGS